MLIAWENEAFLSLREFGADKFEIVVPSLSILAEPPVAVVDKVVERKGTRAAAEAYLEFLYGKQAQEIAARQFYRPSDPRGREEIRGQFSGSCNSSPSTRCSADGATRRRPISPTRACSTRFMVNERSMPVFFRSKCSVGFRAGRPVSGGTGPA